MREVCRLGAGILTSRRSENGTNGEEVFPSKSFDDKTSVISSIGYTSVPLQHEGSNPGRTANKARENLRAVMSWAWEQDILETLPRFPKPKKQRDVAGRHYLTKAEINALYFATHTMKRPRGWD